MTEGMKVVFLIRRGWDGKTEEVTNPSFIGLIRGLSRCYRVGIESYEGEKVKGYEDFYFVTAMIPDHCFERVKGQAGSYGVKVMKVDAMGDAIED